MPLCEFTSSQGFYETFHATLSFFSWTLHEGNREYSSGLNFWWIQPLISVSPLASFFVSGWPTFRAWNEQWNRTCVYFEHAIHETLETSEVLPPWSPTSTIFVPRLWEFTSYRLQYGGLPKLPDSPGCLWNRMSRSSGCPAQLDLRRLFERRITFSIRRRV